MTLDLILEAILKISVTGFIAGGLGFILYLLFKVVKEA